MEAIQALSSSAAVLGLIAGVLLVALPAIIAYFLRRARRNRGAPARADLLQKNRRNELIVEASGEGILELDNAGIVRYANPAAARLLAYTTEELIGLNYHVLVDAPENDTIVRHTRYTTDVKRGVGAVLKGKDGRRRPVEYRIVPITENGQSVGTVLSFNDISERERLDAMLRDTQITAHVGGWELTVDSGRLSLTDEVFRIYDLGIGSKLGLEEGMGFYDPEDRPALRAAFDKALQEGRGFDLELRLATAKGRRIWVRSICKVDRRGDRVVRLYGTIQDITDRKLVERELRETRDFYQRTLDALPVGVAYVSSQLKVAFLNQSYGEWRSVEPQQVIGLSLKEVLGTEHYADVSGYVQAALAGEIQNFQRSGTIDGRHREWRMHFIPERAPSGEIRGFFAILHDLTDFKRLEEHLLRAQKMQAIGQLTGGIAHDFNNLLGIVLGNLQLLERGISDDPLLSRKVRTAMRAAMRGADLTRRLLAFARRQILDPVVLDLCHLLTGLGDLLQRTLGDSIEVRMSAPADLWHTRVDPGQLENAIINLAINARDAMPAGGRLKVEARNVRIDSAFRLDHPQIQPGDFVAVSVEDNGAGIAPDVLKRVFEPFFTTKEHGKGSGLGLPMVHGFAEQSGGVATIESEVGKGTTVTLLLPRSIESEEPSHDDTIVQKMMPGGHESILVVEDDPDLRETVVTALRQLGYQTLEAANAKDALVFLAGGEKIDLLFTDVMMPGGMLGPALAQRAREFRPGLGVLFTTGYAESGVLASGDGVVASDVIPKPYRNEDLALRIRQVIDRETRVA